MKKLLIAGIDPGTTSAYAILDLYGNVLRIKSARNLGLSSLIMEIIEYGQVLVVGTDVNVVPQFIAKFASKTGARIIKPKRNLRVEEKRELVKDYNVKNEHARDALSSALFAYKLIKNLLSKIEYVLIKNNKTHLFEDVTYLVLIKSYTITDAITMLERKEVTVEKKKRQKSKEKIIEKDSSLINLNKKLEREVEFLRKEKQRLVKMMQNIVDAKVKKLMENKEERFNFLNKKLEYCRNKIIGLEAENKDLLGLVKSGKYIWVKKIDNLTKQINDKIIIVENPNVFTETGLDSVNKNADFLIYVTPISTKLVNRLNPILIDFKKIDVKMYGPECFVNKDDIKGTKKDILDKVLEEYQKEREKIYAV